MEHPFDVPHDFRRQPLRVAVAVGFAVTAIASALPWIEGVSGFGGRVAINGYSGSADGGFFVIFGIVLTVLAMSRGAAEGASAAMRLMPGIVGVVLVFMVITAYLNVGTEIRGIEFEGGHATTTMWLWVSTAGTVLMAAAGMGLTVADRVRRGPWVRPGDLRAALRRDRLVPIAGAVVGAAVGFVGILSVGARSFESEFVLAFVVAALLGAIVGGWLGYSVGRWLVIAPPDRRP